MGGLPSLKAKLAGAVIGHACSVDMVCGAHVGPMGFPQRDHAEPGAKSYLPHKNVFLPSIKNPLMNIDEHLV